MSTFTFSTDEESDAYCIRIAQAMVQCCGVSRDEAIGRINRAWNGQALLGPDDWVYHEMPEYWARTIYYGPDVHWWVEGKVLTARPYP